MIALLWTKYKADFFRFVVENDEIGAKIKPYEMRKISILFLLAVVAACNSDNNQSDTVDVAEVVYACPMECEGEKTYAEAGECPVCGMDLQVADLNTEESHHGHDH